MKNLKKPWTNRHLSQFELAELSHTGQQSVWKYENDLAQSDLGLITAFVNYFNTSIDYLVENTNNPRKYEALFETELNEEELAHLCLYRASAPEVRELPEQMVQLCFDMQNGSERE